MTLFRKVFQNQSSTATADEDLDEAALRAAFKEVEPLKLDAFERGSDDHEPYPFVETAEEGARYEDEFGEDEAAETEEIPVSVLEEPSEEDDGVLPGVEVADLLPEEIDVNAQQDAGMDFQSDEEIAACLGRALAAEAPETQTVDAPEDDVAEQDDAASPEEEVNEECSAEDATATAENEVAPAAMDVTSFAQQQMATLEAEESPDASDEVPEPTLDLSGSAAPQAVPAPAPGRAGRRAGRVKTRLLGFNRTGDEDHDPFGQAPEATATAQSEKYPVGWLVIVEGPGVGHSFSIFTGASMIGRGEDQVIRLDFGDNSISRHNHAAIAYDEEQNKFYIGHGGKSNIIRRNARPVLSTEELNHADLVRIGETTLRFVALCGSDFQWSSVGGTHAPDA